MLAALLSLLAGIDLDAGAEVVAIPMLLMGLGIGALASQLGAVAVSALPDERSGEVGGSAEHGIEPRHLAGHRARGLDTDRGAHHLVHRGHPGEPGRA
jgi:hypothetical protein